jgi:hypothetical protein
MHVVKRASTALGSFAQNASECELTSTSRAFDFYLFNLTDLNDGPSTLVIHFFSYSFTHTPPHFYTELAKFPFVRLGASEGTPYYRWTGHGKWKDIEIRRVFVRSPMEEGGPYVPPKSIWVIGNISQHIIQQCEAGLKLKQS